MTQTSQPPKTEYTPAARALLRRARYGILSTFSKQVPGYPFGSVLPCALTPDCEPILCISTLAAHTQNILQDPHVSFTVVEPSAPAETQAHARFVYLGVAEAVEADRLEQVRDRFVELVPSAQMYVGFGDFKFYTLKFTKGRYIGGFGAIAWISSGAFVQADAIATRSARELQTLNDLCSEELAAYANRLALEEAVLANVDTQGFDLRIATGVVRLEFDAALDAAIADGEEFGDSLAMTIEAKLAATA